MAETVPVYFDSTLSQSRFAAAEIQSALINKGHVPELKSLSALASNLPQKKIVLARPGTPGVSQLLTAEGGIEPQGLDEQAFALITTGSEKMTYWVLGGDANGVMYGGLHLAERIRAQGIAGRFDHREAPYLKNRGIKLNLPLLFETFPDLDGLGITAGENMSRISAEEEGKWMWETYGQGRTDYARAHPNRNITFIHRWHQAEIAQVMNHFGPLLALPNVRLDMSYKYSAAHVYSTPTPRLIYTKDGNVPADLARNNKKTWLEVRNDDFYFLHWADPEFVREYLRALPGIS